MFADYESISVGDRQFIVKEIQEADLRRFVELTGDDNPLHVDRAFAETTPFKDLVVHGMLGASLISTVIGTKLPGPGALWVSQNIEFLLPVRLGDTLTIEVRVEKKNDRERLLDLSTTIHNQKQQLVLSGTGRVKLLISKAPEANEPASSRPRVAIVTGGSGGIGREICKRLVADGCKVIVNFRGQSERAQKVVGELNALAAEKGIPGDAAYAVQADISTEPGAIKLYESTLKKFGNIDILVNNAASSINPKPFVNMSWEDIQSQLDVQLKGTFLITRKVVTHMIQQKWGRIVNITSQVLDGAPSVTWTSYATAKGALHVFSKYLAAELGPHGITVNCVSPGMCETSLIGDIPEKVQLMVARQTPLRRLAKPADVAAAVSYLVSSNADYVTGDTIAVNGGIAMR